MFLNDTERVDEDSQGFSVEDVEELDEGLGAEQVHEQDAAAGVLACAGPLRARAGPHDGVRAGLRCLRTTVLPPK